MPSRVRRCAGRAVMSRPSKMMWPPSTGSEPDTQLISVVLPEPLGPISPKRSPGFTAMLTWLSARKPRSEEHTSELQSHSDLVCRLLLEKKKKKKTTKNQSKKSKPKRKKLTNNE